MISIEKTDAPASFGRWWLPTISLLFGGWLLTSMAFGAPDSSPLKSKIIVLDPGHGTADFNRNVINSGKFTRDGLNEHELTFGISQKLGDLLAQDGATVFFTRSKDDYWRRSYTSVEDNKARALFANEVGADAMLSIHCDWHPSSKIRGVTTFYWKKNSESFGRHVHRNMVGRLKSLDRKLVRDIFTVLDTAEMPALLVETGFMSNRLEAKKLSSQEYQEKVAKALHAGLAEYFNSQTR